ncbi:MAG: hypothetical protein GX847_04215 [Clostridiales bacterium]|nr:hypothetical protein [Clostridiales bacterium]
MTTVYKLKKKKNKKHRLLKAAVSVLILAAVSVVAAILITNNGKLTAGGLSRLFSGAGSGDEAAEFSFSTGFRSVFTEIDGGLAVCSGGGVHVYDIGAKLMFTDTFEMTNPTVCSTGKKAAVFDLGGKSLRVFDLYGVTKSMTAAQNIISASLNENGWMALCTQETGAYKGRVTVYNGDLNEAFYWSSAKGYILSATISPDNKSLAVLTLTEEGSRIVFLSLDSADEKGACTMPGELILEIKYLSDNRVLAVGSDMLYVVTPDGEADALFDYPDYYLNDYSVDGDGFVLLALNDYMVGDQGRIVTANLMGKALGVMETDKKIVSVSAKGDSLAVLYSDSLVIYDRNLKESARFDDTAGAEQVIVRPDGKVFLITSHTASVHSISDDT